MTEITKNFFAQWGKDPFRLKTYDQITSNIEAVKEGWIKRLTSNYFYMTMKAGDDCGLNCKPLTNKP